MGRRRSTAGVRWPLVIGPEPAPERSEGCSSALKPIHRRGDIARGRLPRPALADAPDLAAALQVLEAGKHLVAVKTAVRAAIAVENKRGSLPRAARKRSGRRSVSRSPDDAAAPGRAAQPRRGRVPNGARTCVRPADRPQSGLGTRRTTRSAPAVLGGPGQTDAIHDRSRRPRGGVGRFYLDQLFGTQWHSPLIER